MCVIFINGKTDPGGRGSPYYWYGGFIERIVPLFKGYLLSNKQVGYFKKPGAEPSSFCGDFLFVDGNRGGKSGNWPFFECNRYKAGKIQGRKDADIVFEKITRNTETVKQVIIVTHSRGGAFGNGYINALRPILQEKIIKSKMQYLFPIGSLINFVLHLGPHGSSDIRVKNATTTIEGTTTIALAHHEDMLASAKVKGKNVLNIYRTASVRFKSNHEVFTYTGEAFLILKAFFENGKENIISHLQKAFTQWDTNRKTKAFINFGFFKFSYKPQTKLRLNN
jgi:hypothetical protein